ncbi:MAG: hypothetical protein KDB23_09190 [Planctomycetales bacterium]|nr:hypothetical protein [Planctomycetales bacterium]
MDGDAAAIHALMQVYRFRLRQMMAMQLDRRLRMRMDPSDVVQDVLLKPAKRLTQQTTERYRARMAVGGLQPTRLLPSGTKSG